MEDGPHRNSSEQVRLELRATLNATLSIQEPATKMHPVYESGWYRIQEQFQEIQVSIQVMIDRWPGNSLCPWQVTRKLKVTRRDTCRVMWPGNSMCPPKRTPSAGKMTPSADRRTPAIQCHPGILNINHWKWGFGHQSYSPPLIVTNLYLSRLPRLLSHLGFCLCNH